MLIVADTSPLCKKVIAPKIKLYSCELIEPYG